MWLNRLLETMQSTIRQEMTDSVISYEEKPRDQWLFEPPAQVSCHLVLWLGLLVLYPWLTIQSQNGETFETSCISEYNYYG